ncbi:hypothetical protein Tco_0129003 [Tanacetum coccineum]
MNQKDQHVTLIKRKRKGFIVIGGLANSISIQESRSKRRRMSQLTIDSQTDEAVADMYHKWRQKLKGEGSSDAHNKYYSSSDAASDATLYSSSLDKFEESANETDDADESNMDLPDDNPHGDDDEIFLNANAHHISSLPAKKIPYPITTPQQSSLQAKAKKVMQKAKKNMRKINFKKAVAHKLREYDQKLEALTNFNVSEAFEKLVQAKILTEIKKLLPTHIPNAIANYVKPRLNISVLCHTA